MIEKKLVRHHIDLSWNKGRTALAEQLHSKDFLYKSSFIGRPLASPEFAQMVQDIRNAMPDLQVVIEECIAEGNKVVTWSTLIGTIQKPALGYPPSDKVLSISAMAFWTITRAMRSRKSAPCSTWRVFAHNWAWPPNPLPPKHYPEQPTARLRNPKAPHQSGAFGLKRLSAPAHRAASPWV